MISHSACRVLSFDVSMRISTIRVGLALRCMCTSCTDRSRRRIGSVLHGFTLESASASSTSLPGTYLMLTSYCCMLSSIRANLGGQRRDVWCRWTQVVCGPYALPRAVHRRIGGIDLVQTRCPTFRVQCWSSDFRFQPVTYWRMRWGHWPATVQP